MCWGLHFSAWLSSDLGHHSCLWRMTRDDHLLQGSSVPGANIIQMPLPRNSAVRGSPSYKPCS